MSHDPTSQLSLICQQCGTEYIVYIMKDMYVYVGWNKIICVASLNPVRLCLNMHVGDRVTNQESNHKS